MKRHFQIASGESHQISTANKTFRGSVPKKCRRELTIDSFLVRFIHLTGKKSSMKSSSSKLSTKSIVCDRPESNILCVNAEVSQ